MTKEELLAPRATAKRRRLLRALRAIPYIRTAARRAYLVVPKIEGPKR